VGAGGIRFQILAPTVQAVACSLSVPLAEGLSLATLESELKSTIISYVKGLGVGESVILARIIDRVMDIRGIEDVEIISPTENVEIAQNELARTKASLISFS